MKQQDRKWLWRKVLLIVLTIVLIGMWAVRKEGLWLDEVYSYGLANSSFKPFVTDLHDDWETMTVFTRGELKNYVSVAENERFQYEAVYYNQTHDVHPPFFYFLLHTVCSLFPGSFTKWTGLCLNFVIFTATMTATYLLGMELTGDKGKSLFACALLAFSKLALSHVLMVRMYALLTLFTVLLALLVIKVLHKPTIWNYVGIGLVICLGMLTQYFYVIYAFLLCAGVDLYLLYHRHWKKLVRFSISALAGVGAMMLIYPCWYLQITTTQPAVSLDVTASNALNLLNYPIRIGRMLAWTAIDFWTSALILLLMAAAMIAGKLLPQNKEAGIHFTAEVKLIALPAFVAFLVIAIIAPYEAMRYICHLQPVAAVFLSCGFFEATKILKPVNKKRLTVLVLAAAFAAAAYMGPEYMCFGEREQDLILEKYAQDPVVLVSQRHATALTSLIPKLLYFEDVCVVDELSHEGLENYLKEKSDTDAMVLAVATYPAEKADADDVQEWAQARGYHIAQRIPQDFSIIYLLNR